jgi:hypothetical protein
LSLSRSIFNHLDFNPDSIVSDRSALGILILFIGSSEGICVMVAGFFGWGFDNDF